LKQRNNILVPIYVMLIIIFGFNKLERTTKIGLGLQLNPNLTTDLQLNPNLTTDVTCIWTLE